MPDIFEMFTSLISAIFLFLFGMHLLGEGLKNVAQHRLKAFFNNTIKNRVVGALFGMIVTILIQSSTATTVMVIGFVNAGLMTLGHAASITIGANIGTTLTGHIMAIRISDTIPFFLGSGGFLFLFVNKEKPKEIGRVLLGFGLLFMGLGAMSSAMRPLAQSEFFGNLILTLEGNILLGVIVGAVITAVVQSSSAATAIVLSLAMADAITFTAAVPIVFGMNIGTTLTALISSVSANSTAKKAAIFQLVFNILGTLMFLPFVSPVSNMVQSWGGQVSQQIANLHTVFNVVTAIVVLPFINPILKFVSLFVKENLEGIKSNRMDQRFLESPSIAFEQAFQESIHMYELAVENFHIASEALLSVNTDDLATLYENENTLNQLEWDISSFLASIPATNHPDCGTNRIAPMIRIINDIERIGDHCKNLAELAQEAKDNQISFSPEALEELKLFIAQTKNAVHTSLESFKYKNHQKATETLAIEEKIDTMEEILRDKHIDRLNKKICSSRTGAVFLDSLTNFERIGDHAENIAEFVLDGNNLAPPERLPVKNSALATSAL